MGFEGQRTNETRTRMFVKLTTTVTTEILNAVRVLEVVEGEESNVGDRLDGLDAGLLQQSNEKPRMLLISLG